MIRTRPALIEALTHYHSPFREENEFLFRFLELLKHPRAYFRDHLPGHITGSAWIVDEQTGDTLLVHHAKLKRWLQPGGHADGDEDILAVSLRETEEETGLKNVRVAGNTLFDIDIHAIPARADFPQHEHYDIRFLIMASKKDPLIISPESLALEWLDRNDLDLRVRGNRSMQRMAEKVKTLF